MSILMSAVFLSRSKVNLATEEIWEWSGATWTQRPVDSAPAGRYRAAVAFDAARHEMVTFGGRDQSWGYITSTQRWRYRR